MYIEWYIYIDIFIYNVLHSLCKIVTIFWVKMYLSEVHTHIIYAVVSASIFKSQDIKCVDLTV